MDRVADRLRDLTYRVTAPTAWVRGYGRTSPASACLPFVLRPLELLRSYGPQTLKAALGRGTGRKG